MKGTLRYFGTPICAITWALTVSGVVRADPPPMEFVLIPAVDAQLGGPAHDYRIGRFEVRNDQFAAFLNDAMVNLDNERGQFMYFDVDSGDVYIHSGAMGVVGTLGSGTFLFDTDENPYVSFNDTSLAYEVTLGYEGHPVSGVSWYGAIKFCNWMTIEADLGLDQRAYTEAGAADLGGWHPVSITKQDWATRDLTADERAALLLLLGFRLPMDSGIDVPAVHNEWLKAATARLQNDVVVFNAEFGFGRDVVGSSDANYVDSGDPFEPGTTPTGYYDGTSHDGFLTAGNENAYGIFDLSGNVWEWLQDQSPSNPLARRSRGGSWQSLGASLRLSLGVSSEANSTAVSTGFRVVQRVLNALVVTPRDDLVASGVWGGPYDELGSDRVTYRIENVSPDTVSLTVSANAAWVSVSVEAVDLLGGESADITVSIAPACADGLPVGTSSATVRFRDTEGVIVAERGLEVTVVEPMTIDRADGLASVMPFGRAPIPPNKLYILGNVSEQSIAWSAAQDSMTQLPWVTLTPGGDVPSKGSDVVNVAIDTVIAQRLDVGTYQTDVTMTDDCTGESFGRVVTLDVVAPFDVLPADEVMSTGVFGGPFDPAEQSFTVTNAISQTVTWTVTLCSEAPGSTVCTSPAGTPWLVLDASGGSLFPTESKIVTASLTSEANALPTGDYSVTLRFTEPTTGFVIDRVVSLEVTGLRVDPEAGVEFIGPSGGPFTPDSFIYEVRNTGLVEMSWVASVNFSPPLADIGGVTWLVVSPASGVIVDDTGVDVVTLSLHDDTALLPAGSYEGTIEFSANGAVAHRTVTLLVGEESFSVQMRLVPRAHNQPFGPTYDFRIGQHEITSAEYALFLNNALRNAQSEIPGVPDARSQFMHFDTDSGNVYINDTMTTLLFNAGSANQTISFAQGRFTAAEGMEQIPVTGVTWYGAVKFCNWMTIIQGMTDPDERVYHEGPAASDWFALTDAAGLLSLRGFRLPMDDQSTTATILNEWYKAAAWLETTNTEAVYGFGRDGLNNVDANFRESADPFEDQGATPVGFYNGSNTLADGSTVTVGTTNGYGLYDMTGNVAEWVHDEGAAVGERGIRGGHFASVVSSSLLRNDGRGSAAADAALHFIGFRVVQVVEPIELAVGRPPLEPTRATGFVGGSLDRDTFTLEITNTGGQTADNLLITSDVDWLEVDGAAPEQIAPGETIAVALRVLSTSPGPGVSPAPPGDFALVPKDDIQSGGPDYDYWISRTEVANSAFAVFLNGARSDALSGSPTRASHYMYFDLDSGSVYINDAILGAVGFAAPSDTLTTMMYDATIGRIRFESDAYVVEPGFENHPVVGVSWYGALKYCNWLGLAQGIPESLLVYDEATSPIEGWRPVVVSEHVMLDNETRGFLVEDTLGYRLPMDDKAVGASLYNEWYKAASRGGLDELGDPLFGIMYGTGRDAAPTGVDANFFDSGDTQEDGTTPVRFFNNNNTLFQAPSECFPPPPDGPKTIDTDNGYDLYDTTGNVAEWTQDFFAGDASSFAVRGGSWRDVAESELLKTTGRDGRAPDAPDVHTGFRMVRGTGHVGKMTVSASNIVSSQSLHYILDLREPFSVTPRADVERKALYGDLLSGANPVQRYLLTNRSASEMDWAVTVDQTWIDLKGPVLDETSGTVASAGTVALDVTINGTADDLPPGDHMATITIRNETTNRSQTREIKLSIGMPIGIEPTQTDAFEFSGIWHGPFDTPAMRTFTLTNLVGFDLSYEVMGDQSWFKVEPSESADALTGTLLVGEAISFDVSVTAEAESLGVGIYDGNVSFVFTDPGNIEVSESIDQPIVLNIDDPIAFVDQAPEPWQPLLDPDALASQAYVLSNSSEDPVEVKVSVDADWVDLDSELLDVLPGVGRERTLTATLNANALALLDGIHSATISFEDMITGIIQCRTIELSIVEDISVTPFQPFETAGVAGGFFTPPFSIYQVTNAARDENGVMSWEAIIQPVEATWLRVSGEASTGGVLDDGESVVVVVSIDPGATAVLPAGAYEARVEFRSLPGSDVQTRTVSLTIAEPRFVLAESVVAGDVVQPNGPEYSFKMGTYPVTNAEYVAFLNDALAHLDEVRGQYMFFDSTSGDVYMNSAVGGEVGADPGGRTTLLFSPSTGAQIEFSGGVYSVVADASDFSIHPVTGVSWYGALKYANWLTIDQGMLASERCYAEATDASVAGWHPVTIATEDWINRDLNDTERLELVTQFRCYRLPMDQGYNNANVNSDTADEFNEWYKAAAWNATLRTNTTYGFGRNQLTEADANYLDSTDPFDNGTTPVGYYDGYLKAPLFQTEANENGFGLFDMVGNVLQWLQGRHNTSPDSLDFREIRGGSWSFESDAPELRTNVRTFTRPAYTRPDFGFRVVRVSRPSGADFDGDGDVDADDYVAAAQCVSGPAVEAHPACTFADFQGDGHVDLKDFAKWQMQHGDTP